MYVVGGVSEEDSERAGLTRLMVRTALKGTTTRSALQIAEEGEMLGGSVGAAAGPESFGWSVSVPARYAAGAIELLADVVQHCTLDADALETERAIALSDLVAMRDDMYRYPTQLAMRAAFAGHAYGTPPGGSEETLARIDRDAIREWHQSRALTSAAVIGIVGDGDPEELARLVARGFGELRYEAPRPVSPPDWPRVLTTSAESRDRAQSALTVLFPGPSRGDGSRYSASMIASVASGLGGRFFDELRDKRSLCYTVNAFASDRRVAGVFGAYIATSPHQEEAARAGLLAEFRRLREEPVTADELERAQRYAIGVHAIRQQSGGAVLADLVDAYLFGTLSELADHDANVNAVTAESMRRVAERYFDPSRRVEGIVRGRS
jgi:zinc protease